MQRFDFISRLASGRVKIRVIEVAFRHLYLVRIVLVDIAAVSRIPRHRQVKGDIPVVRVSVVVVGQILFVVRHLAISSRSFPQAKTLRAWLS